MPESGSTQFINSSKFLLPVSPAVCLCVQIDETIKSNGRETEIENKDDQDVKSIHQNSLGDKYLFSI